MARKIWVAIDEQELYPIAEIEKNLNNCYRVQQVPVSLIKKYEKAYKEFLKLSEELLRTAWPERERAYKEKWKF